MQYLILSERKMKITLSQEDMEKYGLLAEETNYDTSKYRKIFWQILDEAKDKCHFYVGEERVLLQMYPKNDKGGELFVTKLGKMSPTCAKQIEESDRVTTLKNERVTYRFRDLSELREASRTVAKIGERTESDVYVDEDGIYYLTVLSRFDGTAKYNCLSEYGDALPGCLFDYIKEHAECQSERDGIEKFSTP